MSDNKNLDSPVQPLYVVTGATDSMGSLIARRLHNFKCRRAMPTYNVCNST